MPHSYDATNVQLDAPSRELLPNGPYTFSIIGVTEKKSSKGDYMVSVKCSVINNLDHNGKWVFHNVTFLPPEKPGAGMAIHFLKTIGQPWEKKFEIKPDDWLGGIFLGTIEATEYKGKLRNEITKIEATDLPF